VEGQSGEREKKLTSGNLKGRVSVRVPISRQGSSQGRDGQKEAGKTLKDAQLRAGLLKGGKKREKGG